MNYLKTNISYDFFEEILTISILTLNIFLITRFLKSFVKMWRLHTLFIL